MKMCSLLAYVSYSCNSEAILLHGNHIDKEQPNGDQNNKSLEPVQHPVNGFRIVAKQMLVVAMF